MKVEIIEASVTFSVKRMSVSGGDDFTHRATEDKSIQDSESSTSIDSCRGNYEEHDECWSLLNNRANLRRVSDNFRDSSVS